MANGANASLLCRKAAVITASYLASLGFGLIVVSALDVSMGARGFAGLLVSATAIPLCYLAGIPMMLMAMVVFMPKEYVVRLSKYDGRRWRRVWRKRGAASNMLPIVIPETALDGEGYYRCEIDPAGCTTVGWLKRNCSFSVSIEGEAGQAEIRAMGKYPGCPAVTIFDSAAVKRTGVVDDGRQRPHDEGGR